MLLHRASLFSTSSIFQSVVICFVLFCFVFASGISNVGTLSLSFSFLFRSFFFFLQNTGEEELVLFNGLLLNGALVFEGQSMSRRELPAALLLQSIEDLHEEVANADLVTILTVELDAPVCVGGGELGKLGITSSCAASGSRRHGKHLVQLLNGILTDGTHDADLREVERKVHNQSVRHCKM